MNLSRRKFLGLLPFIPFVAKWASGEPPIMAETDAAVAQRFNDQIMNRVTKGVGRASDYACVIKPVTKDYFLRSVEYPWPEGTHIIYDGATGEVTLETTT